jgi:hypothetical protein
VNCSLYRVLLIAFSALSCAPGATAAPTSILFVGNSYTFGRVDPVMSYNTANVRDLTAPMYANNPAGTNAFEPHPWGGVAGIFKQFTVQAGLDYDVAMSARNAASLRGHLLNTNPAGWDLRGNIGSQAWDKVVLQEQSDEPLTKRPGLNSNPDYFRNYANKIENYVHSTVPQSFRERDFFPGADSTERQAACVASGLSAGTCSTVRNIPGNANGSAATDVYLYQTWARPNLVNGAFVTTTDPVTGAVTRTATPATTFFSDLEAMTSELKNSYQSAFDLADDDGSAGFKGVAPVGEAFMRAVLDGVATRDMWAGNALTDGLIDLWFDDGTHASKYGSYLSALTLFGTITGLDPQSLGYNEIAARDLGISSREAYVLQQIAAVNLGFQKVPEPASLVLVLTTVGLLGFMTRRRREVQAA